MKFELKLAYEDYCLGLTNKVMLYFYRTHIGLLYYILFFARPFIIALFDKLIVIFLYYFSDLPVLVKWLSYALGSNLT